MEHPIYCISRTLRPAETRYSITELEGLAVIYGIKCFKHYITCTNKNITVFTDHKPLLGYFKSSKPRNTRHCRWFGIINEYKIIIKYEKEKKKIFADTLYRLNTLPVNTVINCIKEIEDITIDKDNEVPEEISIIMKNRYEKINGN